MASATKFIDFFVHDILDYTMLNKDDKNFIKNTTIFSVKDAVDEIVATLHDKVKMKQIHLKVKLSGFKSDGPKGIKHLVKSDQKRIQ